MTRKRIDAIFLAGIMLALAATGCRGNDAADKNIHTVKNQPVVKMTDQQKKFAEILAERGKPQLDTLVQRSQAGPAEFATSEGAFYDILKLREVGSQESVPVLLQLLRLNAMSGRIHGYAAAQSLYCIAGNKYLPPSTDYAAREMFDYALDWQMPLSKQTQFIEQQVLRNLAKDLQITLSVDRTADRHGVTFHLTLKNISNAPLAIPSSQVYAGSHIYLCHANGNFIMSYAFVEYDSLAPKWIKLVPGGEEKFSCAANVRRAVPTDNLADMADFVLESTDIRWLIDQPGAFRAYAIFEQPVLRDEQLKTIGAPDVKNLWSGRAVSLPVDFDVDGPG